MLSSVCLRCCIFPTHPLGGGLPAGLIMPSEQVVPAPAAASLYKWSWEQPGRLNPAEFAVDPADPRGADRHQRSGRSRGRSRSQQPRDSSSSSSHHHHHHHRSSSHHHSERSVSPTGSLASARSGGSHSSRRAPSSSREPPSGRRDPHGSRAMVRSAPAQDDLAAEHRQSSSRGRARAIHLPQRRADGARTHVYIPAAPF